jgi:deoxyadenosine/deoxycytidine kinase
MWCGVLSKQLSLTDSMSRDTESHIHMLSEASPNAGDLGRALFAEVEYLVGGDFNFDQFVEGAVGKWTNLLKSLPSSEQAEEQWGSENWSSLVPQDLIPSEELIESAWKSGMELGSDDYSYVITIGPIGSGKTELAKALDGEQDGVIFFEEEWWRNPYLKEFYVLLGKLAEVMGSEWRSEDLRDRVNSEDEVGLAELVERMHDVQGITQGWFGAYKFRQKLEAAVRVKEGVVLQDVGDLGDANYFIQQWILGLASDSNRDRYLGDFALRQRLTPPSVRHPVALYPFVSFAELRRRIEEERGRGFELGMPAGYLAANYLSSAELAVAMSQLGHSVIIVDAQNNDYREGRGRVLASRLWEVIDETHQRWLKGKVS